MRPFRLDAPVLALVLVLASPLGAQAAPPSSPAADSAVEAYAASAAAARARLIEGFAAARARASESLEAVPPGLTVAECLAIHSDLQHEEDAFLHDAAHLPRHPMVRAALAAYVQAEFVAQQACSAALEEEIRQLLVAGESGLAAAVAERRTNLLTVAIAAETAASAEAAAGVAIPPHADKIVAALLAAQYAGVRRAGAPALEAALIAMKWAAKAGDGPGFFAHLERATWATRECPVVSSDVAMRRATLEQALRALIPGEGSLDLDTILAETATQPAAKPAATPRPALSDRALAAIPVGSKVAGMRTEPKAVSGTVEASMTGHVTQHDAKWLVIRAQERWGRAHPVWDWRFERNGNDPDTGNPRWLVRAGSSVSGEETGHRFHWRGYVVLDGDRLVGRYGFDWDGMKKKGARPGTQELTHPLVLRISSPVSGR